MRCATKRRCAFRACEKTQHTTQHMLFRLARLVASRRPVMIVLCVLCCVLCVCVVCVCVVLCCVCVLCVCCVLYVCMYINMMCYVLCVCVRSHVSHCCRCLMSYGGHTMMAGRLAGRSGWAAAEEEARGRRFQNSGRKKPNLKAKRQDVPKPYIRERAKSLPVKISCLVGLGVLREQRAQSRG